MNELAVANKSRCLKVDTDISLMKTKLLTALTDQNLSQSDEDEGEVKQGTGEEMKNQDRDSCTPQARKTTLSVEKDLLSGYNESKSDINSCHSKSLGYIQEVNEMKEP